MTDRNLDQLLNAWMDLGPTAAPERVADAARLEASATRQTAIPPWWPPRRFPYMNTYAKVALSAAAVVVAALLGYNYLVAPNVGGPSLFSDPTPTPSPSAAAPIDFTTHPGGGAELLPGSYVIDYAAPVEVIVTVADDPWDSWPSAWYKAAFDWGPWHQSNAAVLGFMNVRDIPVDPCDPATGMQEPAVGPTVADLAEALSALPYIEAARSEATLDGYSGELIEVTGLDVPADCGEEPTLWVTTRGDVLPMPDPEQLLRVWVIDVGGNRLVVAAGEPGAGDTLVTEDLQALIDTIQLEVP